MSDQPCQLADFDYHLPEELIAQEPARPREAARLLDASGAGLSDHIIADLPNLLRAGDLLVVNNTSVLPAALIVSAGQGGPASICIAACLLIRGLPLPNRRKNARPEHRLPLLTAFRLW